MKIYTSYFGKIKELHKSGIVPICIAIGIPRFFRGATLPYLAPKRYMLSDKWTDEQYIPKGTDFSKVTATQIKEILNKFKGYLLLSDKWLHLSAGFFIAFWVGLFNPFIGLGLGILAGAAKEVYDKVREEGTPDVWDLVFTIIGALLGFANIFLMRFVDWFIW